MHELIRDPVWQFVGALAGLAALGVPVWLAVYRAHRLAYEYRLTSLVSIHTSVKERVRVLFGELEVSNPTLVLVRMVNAGREPLRATDYETPVRIQFGKDTRVLSAEVDAVAPDNLTVDFSLCEAPDSRIEYVQIHPVLLNPLDEFTMKFIVAGATPTVAVSGRIANISRIELLKTGERLRQLSWRASP